jgi:spore coat polysaccharide biosynthesis protein SpsF
VLDSIIFNMIAAIIQARMGSTRLPNKVFSDLGGKPLIHHVFERLAPSQKVSKFLLAITTNPKDDELVNWAIENGVEFYRGSETDVLERYFESAKSINASSIVRITADDPFKDYQMMDTMIGIFISNELDLITNNNPPSFPEGMDLEIMKFTALEIAMENAKTQFEREHVTQYFYKNATQFKMMNYSGKTDLSGLRWTIDTPVDLKVAQVVYEALYYSNKIFRTEEILHFFEQFPHLKKINTNQKRSAMYSKT